jgi:hypothetical protein
MHPAILSQTRPGKDLPDFLLPQILAHRLLLLGRLAADGIGLPAISQPVHSHHAHHRPADWGPSVPAGTFPPCLLTHMSSWRRSRPLRSAADRHPSRARRRRRRAARTSSARGAAAVVPRWVGWSGRPSGNCGRTLSLRPRRSASILSEHRQYAARIHVAAVTDGLELVVSLTYGLHLLVLRIAVEWCVAA